VTLCRRTLEVSKATCALPDPFGQGNFRLQSSIVNLPNLAVYGINASAVRAASGINRRPRDWAKRWYDFFRFSVLLATRPLAVDRAANNPAAADLAGAPCFLPRGRLIPHACKSGSQTGQRPQTLRMQFRPSPNKSFPRPISTPRVRAYSRPAHPEEARPVGTAKATMISGPSGKPTGKTASDPCAAPPNIFNAPAAGDAPCPRAFVRVAGPKLIDSGDPMI